MCVTVIGRYERIVVLWRAGHQLSYIVWHICEPECHWISKVNAPAVQSEELDGRGAALPWYPKLPLERKGPASAGGGSSVSRNWHLKAEFGREPVVCARIARVGPPWAGPSRPRHMRQRRGGKGKVGEAQSDASSQSRFSLPEGW